MVSHRVAKNLKIRYNDIHPLIFNRSLDRAKDDAELFDPINFKTEYFKSISGLPENWMFLFLGCKVYNTEKYSDGLQLVLRASLAHAYILNSYIYEYVLALLETETFPIDTLFCPFISIGPFIRVFLPIIVFV